MKIAQIAPLYEAVPPALYGGTERVVSALTEELVSRGHEVTLFASGDSQTQARLVPGVDRSLRLADGVVDALAPQIGMLAQVGAMADEFDVIHSHVDYLGFPFLGGWRVPSVTTLHGRLDIPELPLIYRWYRRTPLISISNSQRAPIEPLGVRWVGTVYNGIDWDHFTFRATSGDYLVFLGRMSEEKRPDLAIEVARRVGMPLKLAAKVDAADETWFAARVAPLLTDPLVEFVGEVDELGKDELLRGAAALLFPSCWPEPFGMAMAESMACGTPVLALRHGSVPEVVEDGVTGFIGDSVADLVASVARLGEIDRAVCRRTAEARFSAQAMVDGYEAVYASLLGQPGPGLSPEHAGRPAPAAGETK
ncbi:MAG: glycosyltransferase family 4 protein [Sphaerobacter sp.]|nr:glycosyltransferase family 4 protein [Sphaerobacter sp.]